MLRAPSVAELAKYPITGGVCLLAAGVTLAWFLHYSIEPFTLSGVHLFDQPWRMVTSTLPHLDIFHLAFNVYWTWTFGTFLERRLGHFRFLLIVLLLAIGSGAADLAIFDGGVGLSGVGYGLFGMLWVLSHRDARFAGSIDGRTIQAFVIWFFLCIVLTVTRVLPVANVAHGMGGLLGAALGWAIASRKGQRLAAGAMVFALVAASLVGASVLRPLVNFSDHAADEYVNAGCEKLANKEPAAALPLLQQAVRFRSEDGYGWYNMGVAYDQLEEPGKALSCFEKAVELAPANSHFSDVLRDVRRGAVADRSATQP